MVLKLKRNLCGLRNVGETWFEHCSDGLRQMGYKPSKIDPCTWCNDGTQLNSSTKNEISSQHPIQRGHANSLSVIVCYVDDCVIFSKKKSNISNLFKDLKEMGFVFTDEGDIEEHLGTQIRNHSDGTIQMSQPYLIKCIIEAKSGMWEANPSNMSMSSTVLLHKDKQGKSRKGKWNYRSAISMLNFLVNSAHPELAVSVHQCARFCDNPK